MDTSRRKSEAGSERAYVFGFNLSQEQRADKSETKSTFSPWQGAVEVKKTTSRRGKMLLQDGLIYRTGRRAIPACTLCLCVTSANVCR